MSGFKEWLITLGIGKGTSALLEVVDKQQSEMKNLSEEEVTAMDQRLRNLIQNAQDEHLFDGFPKGSQIPLLWDWVGNGYLPKLSIVEGGVLFHGHDGGEAVTARVVDISSGGYYQETYGNWKEVPIDEIEANRSVIVDGKALIVTEQWSLDVLDGAPSAVGTFFARYIRNSQDKRSSRTNFGLAAYYSPADLQEAFDIGKTQIQPMQLALPRRGVKSQMVTLPPCQQRPFITKIP